jgi:hypothetical protein
VGQEDVRKAGFDLCISVFLCLGSVQSVVKLFSTTEWTEQDRNTEQNTEKPFLDCLNLLWKLRLRCGQNTLYLVPVECGYLDRPHFR